MEETDDDHLPILQDRLQFTIKNFLIQFQDDHKNILNFMETLTQNLLRIQDPDWTSQMYSVHLPDFIYSKNAFLIHHYVLSISVENDLFMEYLFIYSAAYRDRQTCDDFVPCLKCSHVDFLLGTIQYIFHTYKLGMCQQFRKKRAVGYLVRRTNFESYYFQKIILYSMWASDTKQIQNNKDILYFISWIPEEVLNDIVRQIFIFISKQKMQTETWTK